VLRPRVPSHRISRIAIPADPADPLLLPMLYYIKHRRNVRDLEAPENAGSIARWMRIIKLAALRGFQFYETRKSYGNIISNMTQKSSVHRIIEPT